MRLRRRLTDDELGADLRVGEAACEQVQDLAFPGGELLDGRWERRGLRGTRACELLDDRAGHCGCEQRLATGNDVDGGGDLFRRGVLEQKAARSRAQRFVD